MTNGWTGGHYSLLRALGGLYLLVHFARLLAGASPAPTLLLVVAIAAAMLFIAGLFDRVAAIGMGLMLAWLFGRDPATSHPTVPCIGWVLIAHALLPPAPFGSFAARGRVDPRGGWRYPPALLLTTRILMPVAFAYGAWMCGIRFPDLGIGMLVFGAFASDPAWVRRSHPGTTDTVFFDGTCGLCHRGVRFLLAEDASGTAFQFAPLGGPACATMLPQAATLPDAVIVRTPAGGILTRSAACLHALGRLGGLWRVAATLLSIVPRPARDFAYDLVARVRYRVFGRAANACPLLPPDLASRFTP